MRGAQAVLLVAAFAAALQPPKKTPTVRRTNLSASAPDAVAIYEERIVGEGSYGVVVAAIDENNKQYVAKRARKDDRSKRYFEVERTINEKLEARRASHHTEESSKARRRKSSSSTPVHKISALRPGERRPRRGDVPERRVVRRRRAWPRL